MSAGVKVGMSVVRVGDDIFFFGEVMPCNSNSIKCCIWRQCTLSGRTAGARDCSATRMALQGRVMAANRSSVLEKAIKGELVVQKRARGFPR
jgi:hypothetical protein